METQTLTAKSILDLDEFENSVVADLDEHEKNKVQFFIGDLKVEDCKLKIDEQELSDDSTKKVLSQLRVKNNFLELQKKMDEQDWETVAEKLKHFNANQEVFARKKKAEEGGAISIVDLQLAHKKATNGGIQIPEVFTSLRESLIDSSANDYVIKDTWYNDEKGTVSVTLLQDSKNIDVFGNETDMWKGGKTVAWSGTDFSIMPFFERLVCTNGNVARQYGFATSISKKKYNYTTIKAMLDREISQASDTCTPLLMNATKHLQKNNVSVREFLEYRNLFDEEEHDKILSKYFDVSYLNKAYRCEVEGMHAIWKSSADTGKNAYDFFNNITYICSHPKEIKLEEEFRRSLQIKASNILFKETLDLELLAPKITSWK